MPRTYATPSQQTQRKNASKKYRAKTHGLSEAHAEREGVTPKDTMAPLTALSSHEAIARLLAHDDSLPFDDTFSSRQVALLQAYVGFPTDPVAGALTICQSVGYAPATLENAQGLLRGVLERVTSLDDMRRAMRLSGMGEMWWLRRIFQIAQCGSPRVEVQAAKLAGLALGAFDDPLPSAGARIIIEQAEASPDGTRRATKTTIEGATDITMRDGGNLTFPTAKPMKRRKILNNIN